MSELPSAPEIRAHLDWRQEKARQCFAAGRIPSGPEARGERPSLTELRRELDRLRTERDAARRLHREFGGHGAEVDYHLADERLRRFLREHPYLRDPDEKGATGRDR